MGTQYIQPSDLTSLGGINPFAIQQIAQTVQIGACQTASEMADSYLRGRYPLPLLSFGTDIKIYCAYIAVYLLMTQRGYDPGQPGGDEIIKERYFQSVGYPDKPGSGWFPGVQRQNVQPDVTPSTPQPGDAVHDVPQVFTSQQRGWNQRFGKPRTG